MTVVCNRRGKTGRSLRIYILTMPKSCPTHDFPHKALQDTDCPHQSEHMVLEVTYISFPRLLTSCPNLGMSPPSARAGSLGPRCQEAALL